MTITDADLERLRALEKAASKAPWYLDEYTDQESGQVNQIYEDAQAKDSDNYYADLRVAEASDYNGELQRANAALIVESRNLLLALIEEIERLRRELAKWQRAYPTAAECIEAIRELNKRDT